MSLASHITSDPAVGNRLPLQQDSGVLMSSSDNSNHRERRRWFEHEVQRLMDRLYGTALRLTRDPDDAEDIVADAVGKAWAKLDELRDPLCFEGWLFHILNNAFVSEWRRRRSRPLASSEFESTSPDDLDQHDFSLFQQLHQPFLLWWGSAEDRFLNDLLQNDLQRALDALPDIFRVTVVLVEVQGYTYGEASKLLEIPLGTVRSRLSRGRALLQKILWEQAKEAGVVIDSQEREGKRS